MSMIDADVESRGRHAVEQLLAGRICDDAVYRAETVSTNTLAMEHLRRSEQRSDPHVTLFLTDRQTGGRGRHGRSWQSGDDTLTFSLILPLADPASELAALTGLAAGVAVARAIEFDLAPVNTRLKWPNDVYVGGGKVAGILLETVAGAADSVVVGVGVNVGSRPDLGDDPRAAETGDLSSAAGRSVHRYDLLPGMIEQMVRTIAEIDRNVDDLVAEFRSRCLLTGQTVTFQRGTVSCRGRCHGIGSRGELIVETAVGRESLTSGEAQLVRIM